MEETNSQEIVKGITLNQQLVYLLSIIDDNSKIEEQDRKIKSYILNLKNRQDRLRQSVFDAVKVFQKQDEMTEEEQLEIEVEKKKAETNAKYKFYIDEVIDNSSIIPEDSKEKLKQFYLKNSLNLKICDRDFMISNLKQFGLDNNVCKTINDNVLFGLKSVDFIAKPGILEMKPNDVRNLYNHIFGKDGKSRYNRITMDTCR